MMVAGRYRAVRRGDRVFSGDGPRPPSPRTPRSSGRGSLDALDIMVFRRAGCAPPLLLVVAPRRSGRAVARNKFRRRVRMAFLAVLRRAGAAAPPALRGAVVWIRPAKGGPVGCRVGYQDIEGQIEKSLGWLEGARR